MRNFAYACSLTLAMGCGLVGLPANAADLRLDAGKKAGASVWTPNTLAPIKKDDVITVFQVDEHRSHGFVIPGTESLPSCKQANLGSDTILCEERKDEGKSGYNVAFDPIASGAEPQDFLHLRVLQDLPADIRFQCVVHGANMSGTLKK